MLTTPIRQILELPEEYRAVNKRPRRKRTRPAPSQALVDRQQQLADAGIKARMLYDRRTRSYCLAFKLPPGKEVPEWQ